MSVIQPITTLVTDPMPTEITPLLSSEPATGRRAADTMRLKFEETALKAMTPDPAVVADIETIDMNSMLPPGSEEDLHQAPPTAAATTLTAEQKKARLQLIKFKQSFDEFALSEHLTEVNIGSIKRGDVIEINTIVGRIYLQVRDRIKSERAGIGEVLCECHYDLGDQYCPAHVASVQLPICSHRHVITQVDGSKRQASRALKISTEIALPTHVQKLLHEEFFTEIAIYANPQAEKLRLLDIGRGLARIALKFKMLIAENNRRERQKEIEKKQKKEDRLRQKEAQ